MASSPPSSAVASAGAGSSPSSAPVSASSLPPPPSVAPEDVLVQYIAVRKDLKWPAGAVSAQVSHAATSATWLSRDHPETGAYLADLDSMHTVVVGAESEAALRKLAEDLTEATLLHKLWIEQPDGIPTALAVRPARRSVVQPFFKAFKLLR